MRAPLRLQRQSVPGYWKVHGFPLILISEESKWLLLGTTEQADQWVKAHKLRGIHPKRSDLMLLLRETMAQDPLPPEQLAPPLRRRGSGLYQSECGRVRVERSNSGWRLLPESGWLFPADSSGWWWARTLTHAAERIRLESERISPSPTRSSP